MMITMNLTHTLLLLAAVVCSANAFSKYGRTCKDIGCLPTQTCVIATDSCSWSQTEGKECGSYPTCKKTSDVNNSPGDSHGASEPTTRRPFVPPPSGGNAPANPSGGHIYPNVPSAPSAPSVPDNGNRYPGGYDPYGGRPSQPKPNPNPYNPYDGNRDPYGNRDRDPYGNRDPFNDRNKGSSSGGSSTFGDIFNFLRGGSGGSGTRYGTGGSGSNGPSYGDLINALGGGGNRGSGSGGFSDILNSFGNRGPGGNTGFGGSSGNSGGTSLSDIFFGGGGGRGGTSTRGGFGGNDDRRQQPYQPSPAGGSGSGSKDSGFLSGLSSLFGQNLADSLVRNALNGNRGGGSSGFGGGSGNSDFFNSLRYGGLFNEKNGHDANAANNGNKPRVTVSGAGPGGYPTQAPAYPTQAQYRPPQNGYTPSNPNQGQNIQHYSQNNASPHSSQSPQNAKPYGWNVDRH